MKILRGTASKAFSCERVMENEQGTFTSLVFTTTGGMADECDKYHSRLVEVIANKNGESWSSEISWIEPSYALRYYALEAQDPEGDS